MTNLRARLQVIPPDRTAVAVPQPTLFRELQRPGLFDMVGAADAGILILIRDVSTAIATLVQLDGVVERMLLASTMQDPQTIWQLAEQAGCTIVVTDREAVDVPAKLRRFLVSAHTTLPSVDDGKPRPTKSTRWMLTTTGTTGLPKIVGHTLESLAKTTKKNLVTENEVRWGLLYDYTRFAGMQVLLQSLLSGATILAPDPDLGIEGQIAALVESRCTHLSATPTLWRKLLMTVAVDRLQLRQITLGGEIADQRILTTLRARFPSARITHIYASTEAGVGFSVTDEREGFPAEFLTASPAGIALRVQDGRLQVKNTEVDSAYAGTGRRFVDDDGFIDTNDLVERRGDRFIFLGRDNGVINVGGNKVHPELVERVLLQSAGVVEARVYARKNPLTGALVAADVVVKHDGADEQTLRAELMKDCRAQLASYQVPAVIRFVKEIETNATGKVSRQPS